MDLSINIANRMEKDNLYYFVKVFKEYDQLPNQSKTDEILETYWKKVNNL